MTKRTTSMTTSRSSTATPMTRTPTRTPTTSPTTTPTSGRPPSPRRLVGIAVAPPHVRRAPRSTRAEVAFSDDEIAYLQSQPLARLATVNADGQPDVVPVAFELDGLYIWVGGVGPDVARTRKLRNIGAGRSKVSLVVDDLVSMDPFIARAL